MATNDIESQAMEAIMEDGKGATGLALGVLIGAAVGFAAGLLLAPQTGYETRKLVREKAAALRERAARLRCRGAEKEEEQVI